MMKNVIVSAGLCAMISTSTIAQGNPWKTKGHFDFSGDPIASTGAGLPIVTDTAFYNSRFGSANGAPPEPVIDLFPDAEFDSYFAIGSGPGASSSVPYGALIAPSGVEVSDSIALLGVAYYQLFGNALPATLKEVNGVEGYAIFVGRLSTLGFGSQLLATDGKAPLGGIGFAGDSGGGGLPIPPSLAARLGTGAYVEQLNNTLYFTAEVFETTLTDGTEITVHDLYWTTAIPTPGSFLVFSAFGLAILRRRRD